MTQHRFEGAPGLALGVGALVAGFNAWRRSRRLAAGPPLGAAAAAANP